MWKGLKWDDAIDDIIAANWGEFCLAVELHVPPKEYRIGYTTTTDGIIFIARNGTPLEEPAVPFYYLADSYRSGQETFDCRRRLEGRTKKRER